MNLKGENGSHLWALTCRIIPSLGNIAICDIYFFSYDGVIISSKDCVTDEREKYQTLKIQSPHSCIIFSLKRNRDCSIRVTVLCKKINYLIQLLCRMRCKFDMNQSNGTTI